MRLINKISYGKQGIDGRVTHRNLPADFVKSFNSGKQIFLVKSDKDDEADAVDYHEVDTPIENIAHLVAIQVPGSFYDHDHSSVETVGIIIFTNETDIEVYTDMTTEKAARSLLEIAGTFYGSFKDKMTPTMSRGEQTFLDMF
jgi:hypothetical protein